MFPQFSFHSCFGEESLPANLQHRNGGLLVAKDAAYFMQTQEYIPSDFPLQRAILSRTMEQPPVISLHLIYFTKINSFHDVDLEGELWYLHIYSMSSVRVAKGKRRH